jgi:hypothetical protein
MDRLPLRLLAFVLGPIVTRRAAEAGRTKGALSAAPAARALRTPGGASLRSPAEESAAQRDASDTAPPWLLATVGLAALVATGVAATADGGGAHTHKHAPPAARAAARASDIGRDVGGV